MKHRISTLLALLALAPAASAQLTDSKRFASVESHTTIMTTAGNDDDTSTLQNDPIPVFNEGVFAATAAGDAFGSSSAAQSTTITATRIISGATVGADLSDISGIITWGDAGSSSELAILFFIDEPHVWSFPYGSVFGTHGTGFVELTAESDPKARGPGGPTGLFRFNAESDFDNATGIIAPGFYIFRARVDAFVCTGDCTGTRGATPFADAGWDFEFRLETVPPPQCEGDADRDGDVDFADVTSVLQFFLTDYSPSTGLGDANYDGIVNFADVTSVLENFLIPCAGPPTAQ